MHTQKNIALLDIDELLWTETKKANFGPSLSEQGFCQKTSNYNFLRTLKKKDVRDLFLLTDMTMTHELVNDRKELVQQLERSGFRVHGVITPCDIGWGSVKGPDLKALTTFFLHEKNSADLYSLINESFGEFEESENDCDWYNDNYARKYRVELRKAYRALREANYQRLGQAFVDACNEMKVSITRTSEFTKAFCEVEAQVAGYDNAKELVLRNFFANIGANHSWVGEVLVVSNKVAVESYKTQKPIDSPVPVYWLDEDSLAEIKLSNQAWSKKAVNQVLPIKYAVANNLALINIT